MHGEARSLPPGVRPGARSGLAEGQAVTFARSRGAVSTSAPTGSCAALTGTRCPSHFEMPFGAAGDLELASARQSTLRRFSPPSQPHPGATQSATAGLRAAPEIMPRFPENR